MNTYSDLYYQTPNTAEFYRDCIAHAVSFSLDRMPDHSWRRLSSDRPLDWVLNHLEATTTHVLIVHKHELEEQNERWANDRHLEMNVELRIEQSTYLFAVEMDAGFLSYFVERYKLEAH